ncbi:hypothetical protein [Gemmiger sp.]
MKQFRPRLSRRAFWVLCALLVCLRLALTGFQQAYTWVGGAPLDDELMFRAAQNISAGQWLGAYDYLTLSKAMFFPVWLAFLHALHLPYLLGGAALWCGAALLAAFAFSPLWRKKDADFGRVLTLGLFAALAFLPSSWAAYTLRVYRDNIFPALCLYFFAGMAGMALRAVLEEEKPLWPWLLAAGVGLACGYLDREDAGLFLLPFAAAATVIVAVVLVMKRRWKALAAQVIPYLLLGVGVAAFCALNYTHYGVFALSDFSEGSFAAAMGAMMRVDTESDAPYLSVPADARAKIYDAVPELEPIAYWLEEDPQMENDFRDPGLNDYRAGSFYWAIRRAAQFEGIYADAQTADAYWQTVADKINAACDAGTLPSRTGRRAATSQPVTAAYVPATLRETWNGFWHVLALRDCAPYETLRSIGTEDDMAEWSGYLHCGFNSAANAGEDTPYYSPYQRAVFAVMQGWARLYSAVLTVCVLGAVLFQIAELLPMRRKKCTPETVVPWLLLFGIFGIALLRCAMIAFVEVSSFGIGTSTMYLATVHPLLVIYAFVGLLLYGRPLKRKDNS